MNCSTCKDLFVDDDLRMCGHKNLMRLDGSGKKLPKKHPGWCPRTIEERTRRRQLAQLNNPDTPMVGNYKGE